MRRIRILFAALAAMGLPALTSAGPSIFERSAPGVYVVRDDNGYWAGGMSRDITHQNSASYQALKALDLSAVPIHVWEAVRSVRISVFFMVRDYSWHDRPPANGLDESYEIVVNGHVHTYPTGGGAPVMRENAPPAMAWFEHEVPKSELRRGRTEIIVRKALSAKNDDYLYLGIDLSVRRGNSAVTFDGSTWRRDVLTIPGGVGEYMVRVYLVTEDLSVRAVWRPSARPALDDPARVIGYAGPTVGAPQASPEMRLEWDPGAFDPAAPLTVMVSGRTPMALAWIDSAGKPEETPAAASELRLPVNRTLRPSGVVLRPLSGKEVRIDRVTVEGARSVRPPRPPIDMCPRIASPAGRPQPRTPACRLERGAILLDNGLMRCRFTTQGTLKMTSLFNRYAAREMISAPGGPSLFVIGMAGKACVGSRDFRCASVRRTGAGFVAELRLADPALRATLSARMDAEGLRMGLVVTNTGSRPVDFTVAFPVLEGLSLTPEGRGDHYFYPLGGGIFAAEPAIIRTTYGDHQALYQCMDLFSSARGAGLSLRVDDREGWHKILSLRKVVPGAPETNWERIITQTPDEYKPANPLGRVPGTGLAVEYLRRTRGPDGAFTAAPVVLSAHAGDWRTAMRAYSAWAHRVWRFQPLSSRLRSVHTMIARGWGHDLLFKDGRYRDDLVDRPAPGMTRTMTDCLEIMSWWDWSPVGPFGTPLNHLTPDQQRTWEPYIVQDPVTGRLMWNNQPGDYSGYNARFGGLPALRQAIERWRRAGALVTLYTDPFRFDENCPTGRRFGRQWGVVGADGKLTTAYDVLNPCHDDPDVRAWVASTMERVLRETGADGIRLDEYGHMGWACFSTAHPHSYVERGVSQWNKGVAETAALVRAAMDRVRPGLVLTTEHPGYDYLMRSTNGCITYDLSVQACPLRPLECNLQRFFFPECKPYELDYSGSPFGIARKLWNAVGSFGAAWPQPMYVVLSENEDAYGSRDCDPLVSTETPRVYVNRFGSGAKTLWHVYNATGHTVVGPVARPGPKSGEHVIDLLTQRECRTGPDGTVSLSLPRDGVACLARMPRVLTARREGARLHVSVTRCLPGDRLSLSGPDGSLLLTRPASPGTVQFDLASVPASSRVAAVKLLRAGRLVDLAEAP